MVYLLDEYYNYLDDDISELEHSLIRSKTAPARPLNEIEEFRKSEVFKILEILFNVSTNFISTSFKNFDMESIIGHSNFNTYLKNLEKLLKILNTKTISRNYRNNFSKAYQNLYNSNKVNYLTEILDSAQESLSFLYVNGEKYEFNEKVLEKGNKLYIIFYELQDIIKKIYIKTNYDFLNSYICYIKKELKNLLEKFDEYWVEYEEIYIFELMKIELEARKYLLDAIELEKKLKIEELKEKQKGKVNFNSEKYFITKKLLVDQIALINSIANYDGLGRNDLNIEILSEAENTLKIISPSQSLSIRKLSENIKNSFQNIRILINNYENKIELIDPQLCNNKDLVDNLIIYEKYWDKGKDYLINKEKFNKLLHFSNILEGLMEKYSFFKNIVNDMDSILFVIIPMIIIFKSLENEDKGIVKDFLPSIKELENKNQILYSNISINLFKLNENFNKTEKNTKLRKSFIINRSRENKKINNKILFNSNLFNEKGIKTILFNKKKYFKNNTNKLNYSIYNLLEKLIIEIDLNKNEKNIYDENYKLINNIIHGIKQLSIEMERNDPLKWNNFLNVVLDNN